MAQFLKVNPIIKIIPKTKQINEFTNASHEK